MVKTRSQLLKVRVYLEGEEVPCISATIQHTVHGPSTAYVQIPALSSALNLRARSIVEIYVLSEENRSLDKVRSLPIYSTGDDGKVKRFFSTSKESSQSGRYSSLIDFRKIDVEEAREALQYDLVFFGELAGYTAYTDAYSRTINLMCSDFTNHLDSITQYVYEANHAATLSGVARTTLLAGATEGPLGTYYRDGKTNESVGWATLNPPITSTDINTTPNLDILVSGVSGLEVRLAPILSTFNLNLGIKAVMAAISRSYIYYREMDEDFNLQDMVYAADDKFTADLYSSDVFRNIAMGFMGRSGPTNSLKNLLKIAFKLTHFEFSPVPGSPFYASRDLRSIASSVPSGKLNDESKKAESEKAVSEKVAAVRKAPGTVPAIKQALLKPELYFSEPPGCNIVFPDEIFSINVSRHFLSEPTRAIDYTDHVMASEDMGTSPGSIANLFTLSPAIVVNEYGEITSYAPRQIVDIINGVGKDLLKFGQILLPEEVYKGINPVTSMVSHALRTSYLTALVTKGSSLNKDMTRLYSLNRQNTEGSLIGGDVEVDRMYKSFAVKEANYRFLVSRFQPRIATVSTKLLLRLVPGFPALVSEKSPLSELDESTDYFGYFGYVNSVTHVLSQSGGVTTISMSFVRPTNEYLDFFTSSGMTTVLPDYREMGVAPWAVSEYGPEAIHKKYLEWLGGVSWEGVPIQNEEQAKQLGYLGILPMSRAIVISEKFPSANKIVSSARGDSENAKISISYLKIIREFVAEYQRQVLQSPWNDDSVEKFYGSIVRRPIANRLQMLGYLNAYYGVAGFVTPGGIVPGSAKSTGHRPARRRVRWGAVARYRKMLLSSVGRGFRG